MSRINTYLLITILVFLAYFVITSSGNGRYVSFGEFGFSKAILDTRTGVLYTPNAKFKIGKYGYEIISRPKQKRNLNDLSEYLVSTDKN